MTAEKLKNDLSDFNFSENHEYSDLETTCIAGAEFYFGKDDCFLGIQSWFVREWIYNYLANPDLKFIMDNDEIFFEDEDDKTIDLIISGLKAWKNHMDTLRRGIKEEHQVVFIHPSWNIDSDIIKKDFKYIAGNRLGIMSTKDWNFGNKQLTDFIQGNSQNCLLIWPAGEDAIVNIKNFSLYQELKKSYPNIDTYPIYISDTRH